MGLLTCIIATSFQVILFDLFLYYNYFVVSVYSILFTSAKGRRLCFHLCLFVCLSAILLKKVVNSFDEIFCGGDW